MDAAWHIGFAGTSSGVSQWKTGWRTERSKFAKEYGHQISKTHLSNTKKSTNLSFPGLGPPKKLNPLFACPSQPRFDSDPYHPSGICQQCISCSWFFRKARGRPKLAALTGPWIDLGEARSVDLEIYALLCVKSQDTHFFETYRGFGKLWRHRSKACLTTSPQKGTSRKSSMTK